MMIDYFGGGSSGNPTNPYQVWSLILKSLLVLRAILKRSANIFDTKYYLRSVLATICNIFGL